MYRFQHSSKPGYKVSNPKGGFIHFHDGFYETDDEDIASFLKGVKGVTDVTVKDVQTREQKIAELKKKHKVADLKKMATDQKLSFDAKATEDELAALIVDATTGN